MRPYHEPLELEDIFEREEAEKRRAQLADIQRHNEERIRRENEQAAVRQEAARQFAIKVNGDQVCDQYRAAGVYPPSVNANGVPTVSLSLLLSIGWTIQDVNGEKCLVEPPAFRQKPRTREDYANEGS